MSQVTNLGFLRTRLDERLEQLNAAYRSVYGEDIKIDPDDQDGQWLGILAQTLSDLDSLGEVVYHSFNPQSATGLALSRLVTLNGIRRIKGTYSLTDVVLTGMQGVTVDKNSLIKDDVTGFKWATTSAITFGSSGTATVTVQAVDKGAIPAEAGNLIKIDTPVYGWQAVTNPNPAIVGRNEETDEQLRARRAQSTNTPAQCILDAVYGAIINLPEVRLARVYENDEDDPDPITGQAPHSIYCVVEGGTIADIGQVIWIKKTAGTTTIGDIAAPCVDSQGSPHYMNFSRPDYTDAYVKVTVTKKPGYPADGTARIKAALLEWAANGDTGDAASGLNIGESLEAPRLYTPVNTVPFHKINSIRIGTAADPLTSDDIVVPFDGLCRLDASRIVVVEL